MQPDKTLAQEFREKFTSSDVAAITEQFKKILNLFETEPIETAMETLRYIITELETGKAPYDLED